jgi:hypothetical protein
MARAFTKIAFTPTVRAAQERAGSREAYASLDHGADTGAALVHWPGMGDRL